MSSMDTQTFIASLGEIILPKLPPDVAKPSMSLMHHLSPLFPFMYGEQAGDITEIAINRPKEVWVEKANEWIRLEMPEMDYDKCIAAGTAAAKFSNNDFSDSTPILSTVLPNKERAQFVMPPACEADTVSITIRKPSKGVIPLKAYSESGFFDRVIPVSADISPADRQLKDLLEARKYEEFLLEALRLEKNIIVAGATGSGKTTFMKALMQKIPKDDRIITIEDVAELFLPEHPNHVHLFYPSDAGADAVVTPASLLKSCLRMKPTRILLAELRGAEAWDFIQICASGHSGSITSLHAGNVSEVFERLKGMYMSNEKGQAATDEVITKSLYMVIDVVVHMENHHKHGRGITQVWFKPELKLNQDLSQ